MALKSFYSLLKNFTYMRYVVPKDKQICAIRSGQTGKWRVHVRKVWPWGFRWGESEKELDWEAESVFKEKSLQTRSQATDLKTDFSFEGIKIDASPFSFDERHFT